MIRVMYIPPIEKRIPMPVPDYEAARKKIDLLMELEVGDSRFFTGTELDLTNWQTWASKAGLRHGCRFPTKRMVKNGVVGLRIWRSQ